MKASSLNQALRVHEKGSHSSFYLDHKLSQSGQAMSMPTIQQLDLDCPICHQCKITKSIPDPGGTCKTKNSTTIGRNNLHTSCNSKKVAHVNSMSHQSSHNTKDLVCKIDLIDYRSKSLLKRRL